MKHNRFNRVPLNSAMYYIPVNNGSQNTANDIYTVGCRELLFIKIVRTRYKDYFWKFKKIINFYI